MGLSAIPSQRGVPKNVSLPLDAFHGPPRPLGGAPVLVDLFAGAGGFSLGFSLAGFRVQAAFELDEWAADTLESNHPETAVLRGDIRSIPDDVLESASRGADVIMGGPPCQGFSRANLKAGDPKDPRNSLFREFIRAAELVRPRALILENVPGLLGRRTQSGEQVIDVIAAEFRRLGYHAYSNVLQALDYGVPQLRPRLFVVGFRKAVSQPFPEPTHDASQRAGLFREVQVPMSPPSLWDAIGDLPEVESRGGDEVMEYAGPPQTDLQVLLRAGSTVCFNHKAMRHSERLVRRFSLVGWGESGADAPEAHTAHKRGKPGELSGKSYDQNNRRMFPDRPCHTIPASFYANFIHPYKHRNFTPREGARIQTFPDWYRFLGKPTVVSHKLLGREGRHEELHLCQYNQIGNAVAPMVAYHLARHVLSCV